MIEITMKCSCGNEENIKIENKDTDYFENFTVRTDYEECDVFVECDKCNSQTKVTVT